MSLSPRLHWGSSQSRTLTLSQRAVAHATVDAGADLIIEHHPHILQAAEVYRGSAIFYAPGNFVLDHDHPMFHPSVKESILVKCFVGEKRIAGVSFLPVPIGEDGRPALPGEGEENFGGIMEIMRKMSGKLGTHPKISGGEAVLIPQ